LRLSTAVRCDSHLACCTPVTAVRSGSRGDFPARSSAALPPTSSPDCGRGQQMPRVVIGVDPHKRSATIEIIRSGRRPSGRAIRHRQRRLPGDAGRRHKICNPARPTQTPRSTLRRSHNPDPPNPSLEHHPHPPLDTEGCQMRTPLARADGWAPRPSLDSAGSALEGRRGCRL
jgi:hypothetical protein